MVPGINDTRSDMFSCMCVSRAEVIGGMCSYSLALSPLIELVSWVAMDVERE